MKRVEGWRVGLAQVFLGAIIALVFVTARRISAGEEPVHLATDWSHRHLVYSPPKSLIHHFQLSSHVRFAQQWIRRNAEHLGERDTWRWHHAEEHPFHRDWSMFMGAGGKVGAGMYPAKFSFDVTTANCGNATTPDFVVFNNSLPGLATTEASNAGTFTGLSGNSNATSATTSSQIVTIGGTLILYSNTGASATAAGTVTASAAGPNNGDTVTLGPVNATRVYTFVNLLVAGTNDVLRGANSAAAAGNLRAAINDNAAQCVTAAPCFGTGITTANAAGSAAIAGNMVTITAPAAGAANNFWLASSNAGRLAIGGAARTGGAGSNTGLNFLAVTNAVTTATNLVAAINRAGNGSSVQVTASNAGGTSATVTVTSTANAATGNATTLTATAITNFTWAGGTLTGGVDAQANIVAFDNLYSSCTGTVPSTYWAYNTGGTVVTSVALSLDGTQVAFVQTQAGVANLVILKWASSSGTISAPITLATQTSAANYRSCTAPCMYTIPFSGRLNDTNSSPFYDYNSDNLFVGDDPATRTTTHATLHKFTGIFKGNPAEVTTVSWPATLGVEIATSPVYNLSDGQVYVADSNTVGTPTGGFLYRVDATTGNVVISGRLSRGVGFADGPVVDSSNGTIYLYTADFGSVGCPGATNNAVVQMAAGFASGALAATTAQISPASTCSNALPAYAGDFDNAYYTGNAGNIYVCGDIGANPTLYQVAISKTGALGAVTTGPALASAATTCSSVTEFYNQTAAKDWIFVSVQASAVTAAPITCPTASGCLMSFDVTNGTAISGATTTHATLTVAGGPSSVVIDNSSATVGASQVYFSPLADGTCTTSGGVGGCAIQASQSALQ